jgi:hypothetical protein
MEQLTPMADGKQKRDKTNGEHLFDLTTYGGLALVGNEVTATAIVNQKDKPNLIGRAFRACDAAFKKIGPEGSLPYIQGRMNYINFAIIGGFTMVPLIKLLEDNKGKLVRFADGILHGKQAQNDPKLVEAHKEMDDAPKQSWGSLMKGRLLTVGAAYAVDSTIGWEKGMLARHAKGTKFEKYASFDHLSNMAADATSKRYSGLMKHSAAQAEATQGLFRKGAGLLTLSTALTILFYASSKLFAERRDVRIERRETRPQPGGIAQADNDNIVAANDDNLVMETPTATVAGERPGTIASHVQHGARVAAAATGPEVGA